MYQIAPPLLIPDFSAVGLENMTPRKLSGIKPALRVSRDSDMLLLDGYLVTAVSS